MGLGIREHVEISARALGFSGSLSQADAIDELGPEYYRTIADFAEQAGITFNLALEYFNEGLEAVGDVAAIEERLRRLRNMLVTTEFGKVHAWIKATWDEAE